MSASSEIVRLTEFALGPAEEDEPWDVYRKRELLRKFDERVVDLDRRYEWI